VLRNTTCGAGASAFRQLWPFFGLYPNVRRASAFLRHELHQRFRAGPRIPPSTLCAHSHTHKYSPIVLKIPHLDSRTHGIRVSALAEWRAWLRCQGCVRGKLTWMRSWGSIGFKYFSLQKTACLFIRPDDPPSTRFLLGMIIICTAEELAGIDARSDISVPQADSRPGSPPSRSTRARAW
jgi:hypothetical protein